MPTYNDISVDPGALLIRFTITLMVQRPCSNNSQRFLPGTGSQSVLFWFDGHRRISRDCCPRGCFGHGLGLHSHYIVVMAVLTGPLCVLAVVVSGSSIATDTLVPSQGLHGVHGNIDGTNGYQADDIYENIEVENNLYGYQFGSTLSYCLNSC